MYGDKEHSSVAIMMFLPPDVAGRLALSEGEKPEDLHLTVAFLGKLADLSDDQQAKLQTTINDFVVVQAPLKGAISGTGRFNESESSDGKAVVYASFDSADLAGFRQALISHLEMNGIGVASTHGYTPHITLAYVQPDDYSEVRVGTQDITLDSITLGMGDDQQTFQLGQSAKETTMDTLTDIKELSYDQLCASIRATLNPPQSYPLCRPGGYTWIRELYSDRVIIETGEPDSDLYEIPYTVGADDTVTLGEPVQVQVAYQPVPATAKETAAVSEPGQKAGKRMMARMADEFKSAIETLGKVFKWATYMDEEPPPDEVDEGEESSKKPAQKEHGFKVYADKAGKARWLAWTTNAFEDREGEIFRTKALEEDVARSDKEWPQEDRVLLLWHVKGSEFGTCDWRAVVGRFLVESGVFDETPRGEKAAAYLKAHPDAFTHMSHGYRYRREDKADGVYEWLHIKERSVLPAGAAANPWTQFGVKEPDMTLTKEKRSALEQVFGADEAAAIITAAEQKSKELEQDIAYKATEGTSPPETPPETVAPDPVDETLRAEAVKAMVEALAQSPAMVALAAGQKEATEGVKAMQAAVTLAEAAVKALGDRLAVVEQAQRDGKTAVLADLPRRSFYQASKAADTVVDPKSEEGQKLAAEGGPVGSQHPGHPLNHPIK